MPSAVTRVETMIFRNVVPPSFRWTAPALSAGAVHELTRPILGRLLPQEFLRVPLDRGQFQGVDECDHELVHAGGLVGGEPVADGVEGADQPVFGDVTGEHAG